MQMDNTHCRIIFHSGVWNVTLSVVFQVNIQGKEKSFARTQTVSAEVYAGRYVNMLHYARAAY